MPGGRDDEVGVTAGGLEGDAIPGRGGEDIQQEQEQEQEQEQKQEQEPARPSPFYYGWLWPAIRGMAAELCLGALLDLGGVGGSLKVLPEVWGGGNMLVRRGVRVFFLVISTLKLN